MLRNPAGQPATSAQKSQLDAWDERGRRRPDVTLGRLNDSLFYRQPRAGGDRTEQVQQASAEKQPLAVRLHALSALQKTLSQLEYRSQHGAPWYLRAGLSQNDDLLAALFPRYGERAQPLLRDAAAHHLEEQLTAFVQLPPDSPLREKMTKTAYGQLKQYLMLTRPEKWTPRGSPPR
jgi:type VI protein secretion system component VasK